MIRDLDDKSLGQNKVLCSFPEVELPLCWLPTPERQISGYPPAFSS